MRLALVTDAWQPQVNGVVTTLVELVREMRLRGHEVLVIHPGLFQTRPCPGYAGIDLAVRPGKHLGELIAAFQPEAIHLATEGPLGWAGRKYCSRWGLAFTTAFHTRFPEVLKAALHLPLWLGYGLFRLFHCPSSGVMVPTQGVLQMLQGRGFKQLKRWTHGVDLSLFEHAEQPRACAQLGALQGPVWLCVGRVSYEKNIEAFLTLDLPGTKVVCGVGPREAALKVRFPQVRWLGLLPREQLKEVYAAADVFVFPSLNETFGLVMLEAMACGTPVAAYPVDGPLEVLAAAEGVRGGVLHADLHAACMAALQVPRSQARARAMEFAWTETADLFLSHLVPAKPQALTRP